MLSTWNAENTNHAKPGQRGLGGGSRARKILGDAGPSSENPPPASGKGALLLPDPKGGKQQQRRPLGSRSANAPPAGKGGGKSGVSSGSGKPKQRRALGDISNAGNGPAGGGSSAGAKQLFGKQPTPGLKFTVHSDSSRVQAGLSAGAGGAGGGAERAGSNASSARPRAVGREESPRAVAKLGVVGVVDDVEMVLGRTGDEEEEVVQRLAEQKAAKFTNPFTTSAMRTDRWRKTTPPQSADGGPSGMSSSHDAALLPDGEVSMSPDAAARSDEALQRAIDRMVRDDLDAQVGAEAGMSGLSTGAGEQSGLEVFDDDLSLDWLTMGIDDLDSTPVSPLNNSFLTQEFELNFV